MPVDAYAITKWLCSASREPELRGLCNTYNLAVDTHCTVCLSPRPKSIRIALAGIGRTPTIDLEDFLTRHFAGGRREFAGCIDMVNGQVFLMLASSSGAPAVYRVEHNDVVPCDSFGRPGW